MVQVGVHAAATVVALHSKALHVAADLHNLLGDVAVDAVRAQVAVAALVDGVEVGEQRNLVYHLLVEFQK